MTYLTFKYSNTKPNKVIGSGTSLDTSRLRFLVGEKLGINPKNVHGYVIGEHGDSEFVPWSSVTIGSQRISDFLSKEEMNNIAIEVKEAAYKIIEKKGATYYGIGMCLVRITNAILGGENTIITVSNYDKENDVFIGLPAILNNEGVKEKIYVTLNKEEEKKLTHSIQVIKDAINNIK